MKNIATRTRTALKWFIGAMATLLFMAVPALGQYTTNNLDGVITIRDNADATPYPSKAVVTNVVGVIETVEVTLNGFTAAYPPDVDILLVGPNNANVVLMSDVGNGGASSAVANITLTISDTAANSFPVSSKLTSGTYKPTDNEPSITEFAPAVSGPYGSSLTAAFTNINPNGEWKLYVRDDASPDAGSISSWTLKLYTTPILALSTNQITTPEDVTGTVTLTLQDSSPAGTYTITGTSTNQTLIANTNITAASAGAGVYTVSVRPSTDQFGTNTITVNVNDGYSTATTNLIVNVTAVNDAPTITLATNAVYTTAGVLTTNVTATVGDVDTGPNGLTLYATSDNSAVVSSNTVFFSGTGESRTVVVAPVGAATGVANLSIYASDGTTNVSSPAALRVQVDAAPYYVVANPAPVVASSDTVAHPYPADLLVSGVNGQIGNMTVVLGALNITNVEYSSVLLSHENGPGGPTNSVVLMRNSGGAGNLTNFRLTFNDSAPPLPQASPITLGTNAPTDNSVIITNFPPPAPDAAGWADTLADAFGYNNPNGKWWLYFVGSGSTSRIDGGFLLNFFTTPYVASGATNIAMNEGSSAVESLYAVADKDGQITNVVTTSNSPGLFTVANNFDASKPTNSAQVKLTVTPVNGDVFGTNTLTLVMTDNNNFKSTNTVTVAIASVNDAPTITAIPRQTTRAGIPTGLISFTVGDVETPIASLVTTATSSQPTILPDANIQIVGTGATRTLQLFPIGTRAGSADVTVTVNDGATSSSTTFTLAVLEPPASMVQNTAPITLDATTTNATPYPSILTVSGISGQIAAVQATLYGVTHTNLSDLDVLLVAPNGTNVILMSDAGDVAKAATLVFSQLASGLIPQTGQVLSGTYLPTDYPPSATSEFGPVVGPYGTSLNALTNGSPNGDWKLYVLDDDQSANKVDRGIVISGGWSLSIATTPTIQSIASPQTTAEDNELRVSVNMGTAQAGFSYAVTASSGNTAVVPNTGFRVDSFGGASVQDLYILPATNQFGSNVLITVQAVMTAANVAGSPFTNTTTFTMNVAAVDDPVYIAPIADQTTSKGALIGPIAFSASDAEGKDITFTASSSNTRLIANSAITIQATKVSAGVYTGTLLMSPTGVETGEATISLVGNDGTTTPTTMAFKVTVVDAPVFENNALITINDNGQATPYPSEITIAGVGGLLNGLEVTIIGLTHAYPADVDILVVGPNNKNVVLMSDAGGDNAISGGRLMFTSAITNPIPANSIQSGTYSPTDYEPSVTEFAPIVGPYGTNLLTQFAGTSPNGVWKLYVRDDTFTVSGTINNGWQIAVHTAPELAAIPNQTTPEDTTLIVPLSISDSDTRATNLTVTAVALNQSPANLVQSTNLTTRYTNGSWGVSIVPTANLFGTNQIQVTVTDGTTPSAQTFALTVSPVNDAPVVVPSTNAVVTLEDTAATVDFAVSDVDHPVVFTTNNVTLTSVNTVLVSPTNLLLTSTGPNGFRVQVTPNLNEYGAGAFTFSVTDGTNATTTNITISVTPVNDVPVISGLMNTNVQQGTSRALAFTVSDVETPAKNLVVTASSGNTNIVPNANIITGGSGADRTLLITPIGTNAAAVTITVKVDDGTTNSTASFILDVQNSLGTYYANTQPIIINDLTNATPYPSIINVTNAFPVFSAVVTLEGFSHSTPDDVDVLLVSPAGKTVMLMSDAGGATPVSNLRLRFADDGTTLPDETPLTSGTYKPMDYAPGDNLPTNAPAGPYGTTMSALRGTAALGDWKLYVADDAAGGTGSISQGWSIDIITAPQMTLNSALTLTSLEDVVATNVVTVANATTNVAFGVVSSDRTLQPTGPDNLTNVLVDANNNQWQVQLRPALDQTGTNTVTLTVTNMALESKPWSTIVFTNIFTPVNDAPLISRLLPVTTSENKATTISFVVTDVDTPVTWLSASATSSDQNLITTTNLRFFDTTNLLTSIPESQVKLTLAPNTDQSGTNTITVTVWDRTNTTVGATSTFVLNVTAIDSAPTITMSTNRVSTQAGIATVAVPFTLADADSANLTVTAISRQQNLVKDANIVINPAGSSPNRSRTVTVMPESAIEGTANLVLTVTDGNSSATAGLDVVINASRDRSFANTNIIIINDLAKATPYPAEITIAPGTLQGSIQKVTATLNGFTHKYPQDVDILLVAPSAATNVMLMSDAGGGSPVANLTLTFSQSASTPVPQGSLASGTYQPANYDTTTDNFPAPAPVGPFGTSLNSLTNLSPTGTWSLYVQDDVATDGGAISNGWALTITTQPVIQGLTNTATPEDIASSQSFQILEESFAPTEFGLTGTSSATNVVADSGISFVAGKSPYDWTVVVQPVANAFGSSTITVKLKNAANQEVTKAFVLTVVSVNDTPTITQVPNQRISAGTVAGPIIFSYDDAETARKDLILTKGSSNPELIPTNNIIINGDTLYIAPVGALTGVSTVTIAVTDVVGATTNTTFDVVVYASATPLFANSTNIVIQDNTTALPYPSTINVAGVAGQVSQVTVTLAQVTHNYPDDIDILLVGPQTNTVVLMSDAGGSTPLVNSRITFSDTASQPLPDNTAITNNGTYKPGNYGEIETFAAPAPAGPYGSKLSVFTNTNPNGTWSLYVLDDSLQDGGSISGGWLLNIITTSPTISTIADQVTPEDVPVTVLFSVSDSDTAISNLVVTASVADATGVIVSVPRAPLSSTNGSYSLTVTPLQNASGTNTIVVSASDGSIITTTEFKVVVLPVNDAPVIVGLADAETPANVTVVQTFTVFDVETPASGIAVTSSSSNPGLGTLTVTGTNGVYSLEFKPIGVQGNTGISVVASDGSLTTTNSILITVIAPRSPVIAPIGPQTMLEDTQLPLGVTITGTTATDLTSVTASWADTNLIKTVQILGNGLSRVALITPVNNAFGSTLVSIVATDIYASTTNTFNLTVVSVDDPPLLGPIPAQITAENVPVVVPLTVNDIDTPLTNLVFGASNYDSNLVAGVAFAVTSSNAVATVNLVRNAIGVSAVTISVTDGTASSSTVFALQVTNAPIAIAAIANQTMDEDTTLSVPVVVINATGTNVIVKAEASNTNLVASTTVTGSDGNYTLAITLVPQMSGTSTIAVQAADAESSAGQSFLLTVVSVDDGPTLAQIPDQSTGENTPITIPLEVTDPDTALTNLTYQASAYDTNLISDVVFATSDTNVTATVNLVQNMTGVSSMTISVLSGTNAASSTFMLTVTNLPISIAPIAPITVAEDSTVTVPVTVLSTTSTNVQVLGTASDTELVSSVNVVGSGANWIATISLVPNAFGSSTITMTAWDEVATNGTSFLLTVTPVDDAPSLGVIADQTTGENMPIVVEVPVTDPDTAITNLVFGYETNDTNLVSTVTFEVTETNVTATVVPMADMVGTATVTISAASGTNVSYTSFEATWTNLPPSISHIGNISVLEDSPPVVVSFSVINTTSTNVVVTGTASDTNLIESVVIGGGPVNYTATMTLVPNAFGQSFITITATEPEEGSGSTTFLLNVAPVDDAPVLEPIADQTTLENVPVSIPLVITDIDTASAALTFGYSTSDTNLVSNVTFTTTESNVVATVELVANAFGTATVTIDVSDSLTTSSQSFGLTVTKTPPTVSAIPGQVVNEDTVLVVPFTVGNASADGLVIAGIASDSNLVQSVTIAGTLPDYNATITLVPNASGNCVITITATDAAGTGTSIFDLAVTPVEDAPTLAQIPDQETTVNVPVTVPLIISDPDTALTNLTYTWTTSNPSLVSNVTFNVTATTAEATVIPALNATGVGAVTIKVSDSAGLAVSAFALTVTQQNQESELSFTLNGSVLSIGITGAPDTTYTVEGTSDFVTWTDVGTVTTDASGKAVYTTNTTASSHMYYRTKAQ